MCQSRYISEGGVSRLLIAYSVMNRALLIVIGVVALVALSVGAPSDYFDTSISEEESDSEENTKPTDALDENRKAEIDSDRASPQEEDDSHEGEGINSGSTERVKRNGAGSGAEVATGVSSLGLPAPPSTDSSESKESKEESKEESQEQDQEQEEGVKSRESTEGGRAKERDIESRESSEGGREPETEGEGESREANRGEEESLEAAKESSEVAPRLGLGLGKPDSEPSSEEHH